MKKLTYIPLYVLSTCLLSVDTFLNEVSIYILGKRKEYGYTVESMYSGHIGQNNYSSNQEKKNELEFLNKIK